MISTALSRVVHRQAMIGALMGLVISTFTAHAQQQCVETNGVKVIYPPNLDGGLDVLDQNVLVLADDFLCNTTGPVSDIHIWGSWLNNSKGVITNFWLGIYSDVAAVTNPITGQSTNSHPGVLLWSQSFGPGQFIETVYGSGSEGFYDPRPPAFIGSDTLAYYYCFYPTNPFVQTGTPNQPTNYWLAAYAQVADQATLYGWKTTLVPYNDAAVWGNLTATGVPLGDWKPMTNSQTRAAINLAFKLTTPTNTPPPTDCVDTNTVKYVQWPNVQNGYDVWNSSTFPPNVTDGPWLLADDFVCTNTGPITDIHLWGSWLNNFVASNSITFWLGIFTDVAANPPTEPFSHPGNLIWNQCFGPGQYSEMPWSPASEQFIDPGPPSFLGTDNEVWYYCFFPTNPPTQQGLPAAPKRYWLAVYALLPAGTADYFGWKTTTNVQNDVSVHLPFNPPACPNLATGTVLGGWLRTFAPGVPQAPLDLAFKITTRTNGCIVPVACAVDKQVECGSSWSFDPPFVGPDPCCPTPPSVSLVIITNSNATCAQSYSGIFTVTDCIGTVLGVCTQKVSVVDTTPPTITCATNKTVVCGSPWSFDSPVAVDTCCGTNITINIAGTITNNPACPLIVTRSWTATDCCSNTSSPCSQTVTVVDTNPPAIICPTNIVVLTCNTNATVFWTIMATDTCSSVTVTSSPPSGTTFPHRSTNTVVATATDACGNTNTCTFKVIIDHPILGPITIARFLTNEVVLNWTNGFLQSATNVIGPYVDVTGATSPFTNITWPPPPTNRFYRLRCDAP